MKGKRSDLGYVIPRFCVVCGVQEHGWGGARTRTAAIDENGRCAEHNAAYYQPLATLPAK